MAKPTLTFEQQVLKTHKSERLSLTQIAAMVGCSPPTLYTKWLNPGLIRTATIDGQRITTTTEVLSALWKAADQQRKEEAARIRAHIEAYRKTLKAKRQTQQSRG